MRTIVCATNFTSTSILTAESVCLSVYGGRSSRMVPLSRWLRRQPSVTAFPPRQHQQSGQSLGRRQHPRWPCSQHGPSPSQHGQPLRRLSLPRLLHQPALCPPLSARPMLPALRVRARLPRARCSGLHRPHSLQLRRLPRPSPLYKHLVPSVAFVGVNITTRVCFAPAAGNGCNGHPEGPSPAHWQASCVFPRVHAFCSFSCG